MDTPKNREELTELLAKAISDAEGFGVPYEQTYEGNKRMARTSAAAVLNAIEAAGLAVVPVEPTEVMVNSFMDEGSAWGSLGDFKVRPRPGLSAAVAASPFMKKGRKGTGQ